MAPGELFGLFDELHAGFAQAGLLEAMRAVGNTHLIALDATWYFSSRAENIHCDRCSRIEHANGQCTHYHSAITPVIVSPGHKEVVPLRPEFIVPQDGQVKQDREIAAAKIGARRTFFDHLRTLTIYLDFENWSHLMDFMMRGQKIGPYAAQKS